MLFKLKTFNTVKDTLITHKNSSIRTQLSFLPPSEPVLEVFFCGCLAHTVVATSMSRIDTKHSPLVVILTWGRSQKLHSAQVGVWGRWAHTIMFSSACFFVRWHLAIAPPYFFFFFLSNLVRMQKKTLRAASESHKNDWISVWSKGDYFEGDCWHCVFCCKTFLKFKHSSDFDHNS